MLEKINRNIFTGVKIKPVDYPIRMLQVEDEQSITIKDLYKKTQVDELTFTFDRVFGASDHNEDIARFCHKNCISRVFDNQNCCVMTSGVNSSGKSYALFGSYIK